MDPVSVASIVVCSPRSVNLMPSILMRGSRLAQPELVLPPLSVSMMHGRSTKMRQSRLWQYVPSLP